MTFVNKGKKRAGPLAQAAVPIFPSRPFGLLYARPTTQESSERKWVAFVSGVRRVVRCQLGGDLFEDHLATVEPHLGLLT